MIKRSCHDIFFFAEKCRLQLENASEKKKDLEINSDGFREDFGLQNEWASTRLKSPWAQNGFVPVKSLALKRSSGHG